MQSSVAVRALGIEPWWEGKIQLGSHYWGRSTQKKEGRSGDNILTEQVKEESLYVLMSLRYWRRTLRPCQPLIGQIRRCPSEARFVLPFSQKLGRRRSTKRKSKIRSLCTYFHRFSEHIRLHPILNSPTITVFQPYSQQQASNHGIWQVVLIQGETSYTLQQRICLIFVAFSFQLSLLPQNFPSLFSAISLYWFYIFHIGECPHHCHSRCSQGQRSWPRDCRN